MDYRGTSLILNVIEWIDKYIIPKLDGKDIKSFQP